MIYAFAGSDHSVSINLDPPADARSVAWTLRGNAGTVVSTGTIANLATDASASTTILAASNTKTAPTETRFVTFAWLYNGQNFTATQSYVLIDFMPLRCQASDVRLELGANLAEVPDEDIDLVSAATLVRQQITPTIFDAALISGDTLTISLNRMIALWAAAVFATSLPLRIVESMGNEQAKFARGKGINFQLVVASLRGEYERLRDLVTGVDETLQINPTIFTKSNPGIDTIRGPIRWSNFPQWSLFSRP